MRLDVSQLPMVGGHPALDLVNTLERGGGPGDEAAHDYLSDTAALLRWAVLAGLVSEAEAGRVGRVWRGDPATAQAALAAVRDIREGLHLVLLEAIAAADGEMPDGVGNPTAVRTVTDASGGITSDPIAAGAALVGLHERWSGAVARAILVLDRGDPPVVRLAYGTVPALLVPDRIAEAALELLQSTDLTRVHRCPVPEGGCGWLFLDLSRNGSRRWCRMADCGNAVKSRRLTERRRAARSSAR